VYGQEAKSDSPNLVIGIWSTRAATSVEEIVLTRSTSQVPNSSSIRKFTDVSSGTVTRGLRNSGLTPGIHQSVSSYVFFPSPIPSAHLAPLAPSQTKYFSMCTRMILAWEHAKNHSLGNIFPSKLDHIKNLVR
jgi:hypothetical protein